MRALVLGSSGMAGRAVVARLGEVRGVEVLRGTRPGAGGDVELDAFDPLPLRPLLEGVDLVVNAVGTLRSHPDYPGDRYRLLATRVNAVFPILLAEAAEDRGSRVVHISTDAVFAPGDEPADEGAEISAAEPYGQSKALGEGTSERVVNVRCSLIGPAPGRPGGLWEWFVGQPQGAEVRGYEGRMWTGVTSRQLAVLCGDLADSETFARVRSAGPHHHFVPNEPITKLELLRLLGEAVRPDITIVPMEATETAGRPLISATGALDAAFAGTRGWRAAVAEAVAAQ